MIKYAKALIIAILCLAISSCYMINMNDISTAKHYSFKKLSQNEGLKYQIVRNGDIFQIAITASNNPNHIIFQKEGTFIEDTPLSYGQSTGMVIDQVYPHTKWIAVNIYHALPLGSSTVETWFINGKKGTVKYLTNKGDFFTIDDSGEYICIYDEDESERLDTPVVTIYKINGLKKITSGICNELKGNRMSPSGMTYSNGVFKAIFTEDGPNKGMIDIAIPTKR